MMLSGAGRGPRLERRLHGVDQGGDAFGQCLGPQLGAPRTDLLQERRDLRQGRTELDEGRGDDEDRDADHAREEDRVDDQDREPATNPGPPPNEGDERLERRAEQHGDEDEEQDVPGQRAEGEHQHEAHADGEAGASRSPAERLGSHPPSRADPRGQSPRLRIVGERGRWR